MTFEQMLKDKLEEHKEIIESKQKEIKYLQKTIEQVSKEDKIEVIKKLTEVKDCVIFHEGSISAISEITNLIDTAKRIKNDRKENS